MSSSVAALQSFPLSDINKIALMNCVDSVNQRYRGDMHLVIHLFDFLQAITNKKRQYR